MSSKQINKHPCTEERNYQMKLGRRNTYMKITADKKEVMLLQRRTNELQLQKSNPPIEPVVDCAVERTRLHCDPTSSKQTALAIREPSLANIQEHACYEVNTLSRSSDKGKNIFQPFCVFEKGSTSNASTGQQNVTPEIVTNKGIRSYFLKMTLKRSSNSFLNSLFIYIFFYIIKLYKHKI
ncbi:uncharacterized protein LOC132640260 isoform X6 [Lycium barbarum]|uniref:uncharacterized protein LOC132640260 isoform X6 n=1 Tax=Lycium barbarum TaxID=112863 RepID=UPI00293E0271|nr:uncharacterized protein LOC132640260 isoform X6 [Lycium barbarum]